LRAGTIVSIAALTLACTGDRPAPAPATPPAVTASLGGVVVAKVGDTTIDRSLVLAVARARKISAEDALALLINDALLARAAIANGAEKDAVIALRGTTPLSRALLNQLRDKSIATPFTDEEIAAVSEHHWLTTNHPELRRVVHALVKKGVPNTRAVAEELRTALLAANGPDAGKSESAFTEAAKNFKVPSGPPVHVENLRVAEDSRIAEPGADGSVEEAFTKGTFAIADVFGTSELVETTYGVHVIRLLDKTPPMRLTREQVIEKLRPDLIATRVSPAHDQLLNRLRAATKVELVSDDALLAMPR
jgi:hypothetical protein